MSWSPGIVIPRPDCKLSAPLLEVNKGAALLQLHRGKTGTLTFLNPRNVSGGRPGCRQHAEPSFCSTPATGWCALQHSPVSRSRYRLCWRGYQQHGPHRELGCSWASCTSLIGTGAAPWCAVEDAHVADTPSKLGHVCLIVLCMHDFQAA